VLGTLPLTERKLRFAAGARSEIFAAAQMLWCPVIRREVFQRHCYYDANTFGFWRLVSQILAQGANRARARVPLPARAHRAAHGIRAYRKLVSRRFPRRS
jgi:hypothetical protein